MSALRLSRAGAPNAVKELCGQSDLRGMAWGYSPRDTGMSAPTSPLPEGTDSLNKGGHGAALGPATPRSGLGASMITGDGLRTRVTLRGRGRVVRQIGAFPFTVTLFTGVVAGAGGTTVGATRR